MPATNSTTVAIKIEVDGKGGIKVIRDVGDEAKKAGAKGAKAFKPASDGLKGYSDHAGSALSATRLLGGAFAGLTAGAALGGFVSLLKDGVSSLADYERLGLRTVSLIKATGNAAGIEAAELEKFASQLDLATLADRDNIMQATNALQTFRSVSGETFTRAISLSNDLSEVLGVDLRGQVVQLGKALEDPITGMTALRRVGVSFTQQQLDQAKALVQSNQKLEAQRMILDEIERQVGGAAHAAAGGMLGKLDTLNYRWREFKENLTESVTASKLASAAIDDLSRALEHMNTRLGPDTETLIEHEIAGLESRLKIFERLGASGGAALEKIKSRIETLRNSLEELRNPIGDTYLDYDRFNKVVKDGTDDAEAAAKAARELAQQIAALDDAVRASNDNPWDPIGYDIDTGGIINRYVIQDSKVAAAIQQIELERNNRRIETARRIAAQQGIEDTYGVDWDNLTSEAEESADEMIRLTERTAYAMQDNFSNLFFDATQRKFDDLADYVNAFTTSLNRAFSDLAGQAVTQYFFPELQTAAHGGIFSGPGISDYENRVVNRPTFIALAKGGALIGEAGDEAVMPLKEMPSGNLGVETSGATRPEVKVIINPVNETGMDLDVKPRIIRQNPEEVIATMTIKRRMTSRAYRQSMGLN